MVQPKKARLSGGFRSASSVLVDPGVVLVSPTTSSAASPPPGSDDAHDATTPLRHSGGGFSSAASVLTKKKVNESNSDAQQHLYNVTVVGRTMLICINIYNLLVESQCYCNAKRTTLSTPTPLPLACAAAAPQRLDILHVTKQPNWHRRWIRKWIGTAIVSCIEKVYASSFLLRVAGSCETAAGVAELEKFASPIRGANRSGDSSD